ncbi:thiol reductant ABC exporter subunit CydC [Bacillus sp. 03113]|uniref:thiol reductant ABC exporter subunit CydC n=1 Tax=Bacillus sp. 03113 TaxID=2578211 RepID=UPI0011435571|nr:thiol reductant ABC exporter subunit CydC [Bacillus sp. 03113]
MKQEKWLSPFTKGNKRRFSLIIVLSILTLMSAAMLTFTSGFLISKSALRPENVLMVYVPIVGVRTFGISRAVLHYVERLISHDTILRILSKMRVRLYQILEPQALFIRSRYRLGDMLGLLAEDIEQLQNVYLRTIFPSIAVLLMYGIVIGTLGLFDFTFSLLMAFYIFILVIIIPFLSYLITKRKHIQLKKERSGLYQKLTDSILGIGDWMISGRANDFVLDYEKDEKKVAHIHQTLHRFVRWRGFFSQLVIGLVVISLIYWSAQLYTEQRISVTLIAAIILVAFPIMESFLAVSNAIEKIPQYQDSLSRLRMVSLKEPSLHTGLLIENTVQNALISVENVSFRYDEGDDYAVNDISIEIPQGRRIAIIGKSGSGKSTLLKLLHGALIPTSGAVTINGASAAAYGHQISKMISVLNQNPHLFDTTLENNIRLGNEKASDEELNKAIKLSQLEPLIAALPQGYQTPMHEMGQRFSGGERQRIALSRILLQNTPIVLLDEPNAGLDPRTEKELLSTIFSSLQGKTIIWITHHLVGVEDMDEILFMENGKILMKGTHEELMEKSLRYQKLYQLDFPKSLVKI